MTIIMPWHSPKNDVHHNNTECKAGFLVEGKDVRHGTGGRPLCRECREATSPITGPGERPGT
jgi:hypothetical protein